MADGLLFDGGVPDTPLEVFGWLVVAYLLWWLVVKGPASVAKDAKKAEAIGAAIRYWWSSGDRRCFYCKEPVQSGATKCPHCQSDI